MRLGENRKVVPEGIKVDEMFPKVFSCKGEHFWKSCALKLKGHNFLLLFDWRIIFKC
jgi:hypothetical protein